MSFFRVMLRSVLKPFSDYARYADLSLAVFFLTLAYLWTNHWALILGLLSFFFFAIDFNGRINRWSMKLAISKSSSKLSGK